jgi:hypothetical protein
MRREPSGFDVAAPRPYALLSCLSPSIALTPRRPFAVT